MNKAAEFSISHFQDHSLATCKGPRKQLSDIVENVNIIFSETHQKGNNKLLIDYRKVLFNFPMVDAFNLAKMFEIKFKQYKGIKMAVICPPANKDFSFFWQEISIKRGFDFFVSTDIIEGEEWLLSKKAS